MATDWTAEQLSVYEDIKAEGFEITVRTPGAPGEYEEGFKYEESDPVDSITYALKKDYAISQIDGTIIQQKDTQLLFPAYELAAVTTDNQILIDDVVQKVVSIKPVDPGNVALLYKAQIRS